jgi:hypothetical protein
MNLRNLLVLFWMITTSLAQSPAVPPMLSNNSDNDFFSLENYLPIATAAGYFQTDNSTRSILGSSPKKTILVPLDLSFAEFLSELASTPDGPAKTELYQDFNNPNLTDQVLHEAILDGVYNFSALNSSTFSGQMIFAPTFSSIARPLVGIYQSSSCLYIRSGANFSSRVIIPVDPSLL